MKRLTIVLTLAAVLCLPLIITYAAGGSIEGKVTDPKGAGVVGARITLTNKASKQTSTTLTDAEGKYKIEALVAGSYSITVSAKGFSDGTRDEVVVKDDGSVSVDLKLEIASLEAQVKVISQKGNQDPVYQQLRQLGKSDQDFAGPSAVVNNLTLQRDVATFTLRSGEVYFAAPVEGRVTGAVFIGDGELALTPPTDTEGV